MGNKQPTPGEWVILASGAVMLIASFLDFAGKTSAWGTGAFPIVTLIPIYGVVIAAQIALVVFAGATMPTRVAGFTVKQLDLAFSIFALLMAIGWLISGINQKGIG